MNQDLRQFPKSLKIFIGSFLIILNIGYFTGLGFVAQTGGTHPDGIEENYNGNETAEEAMLLKFKKSEREMLTIIHTHILSIGFIFAFLGVMVWMTTLTDRWKLLLTVEPFLSLILTFGGIYMLWSGWSAFKYVVMFSGGLMTLTFCISSWVVFRNLFTVK